jgi:uncharacterized metal-binding protein
MEEKCLCQPDEILVFSCSGSSNVGQIGNLAALKLTQDGVGRMYCLSGIGGHVSGMIESTKAAKMIVGIDGCPVACAQKILEHAGFKADEYVQVTEMGIEKNHGFDYPRSEIDKVANILKARISKRRAA